MAVNMTEICALTPDQVVSYSHKIAAMPSLIIFFVAFFVVLALVGVGFGLRKGSKFWGVYFTTLIFMLVILALLLFLPVTIVQPIKGFFGFG